MIASGERRHQITIETPGDREPDADGGWIDTWDSLGTHQAAVQPATAQRLERIQVGTVTTTITHLVTVPYLDGVSTLARVLWDSRTLNIVGLQDPDGRHIELILLCAEQETPPAVHLETGTP